MFRLFGLPWFYLWLEVNVLVANTATLRPHICVSSVRSCFERVKTQIYCGLTNNCPGRAHAVQCLPVNGSAAGD